MQVEGRTQEKFVNHKLTTSDIQDFQVFIFGTNKPCIENVSYCFMKLHHFLVVYDFEQYTHHSIFLSMSTPSNKHS